MDWNHKFVGHALALLTCVIWGISFISSKILLEIFTPGEILFIRFLTAYLVLWICFPKPFLYSDWKTELLCLGAAFFGMLLYQYLENTALIYTSTSNVGLLVATAPFFTGIAATLTGSEKINSSFLVGFLLSIIGVFLVVFNGKFVLAMNPLGDFLAILAAFIWAFYSILTNLLNSRRKNILQVTRRMFLYATLMSVPFICTGNFASKLTEFLQLRYILNLLFLGGLASGVCFVIWNMAIKKMGAVSSSVYLYLIPVVTLLFSNLLLGEPITVLAVLGTVCILAGLILSQRKKLHK